MTIAQILPILLLSVLVGSYTWGMRGTIVGGERGAMLPGAALALLLLHASGSLPVSTAYPFAATVGAAGMFFGGSQTYGETIGLTHEADKTTRRYARLGLAIKGALWFGVYGGLFGFLVGAMAGRYKLWETILFVGVLPVIRWLGIMIFNTPFDPKKNKIPRIYFSVKRREVWGGLLLVLLYIMAFTFVKHEWVPVLLLGFGFAFGALGFWLGNLFQTFADKHLSKNWISGWKWMECVFGGVGALGIALCWCLFYNGILYQYVFEITAHSGAWSPFYENTEILLAFVWLILLALFAVRYALPPANKTAKLLLRAEDVLIWPVFCYYPLFLAFTGNQYFSQLFIAFCPVYVLAEKIAFGGRERYETVPGAKVLHGVLIVLSAVLLALHIFTDLRPDAYALWMLYLLVYLLAELYIAFNPFRLRARARELGSLCGAFSEIGSHRTWMAYACVSVVLLLVFGKSYFSV